jgi:hypothetical protein
MERGSLKSGPFLLVGGAGSANKFSLSIQWVI